VKLFHGVPELVQRVGYTVITAEGGTAAGTLGDGADVDGYIAAVNLNSAAGTKAINALALTEGTPNTVAGYSGGKFYTAADTIDFIPGNDLDAAVVEFWAICIQP
jgi:large exoprotein involved in heme utilization and adhesion